MKHEELTEKLKEIHSALGKEDVMVCIYKGEDSNAGIFMLGTEKNIVSSLALAIRTDDKLRESILTASKVNLLATTMMAKIFGTEEDKENAQQEADRLAKDFLRNNGFKMEGE